MHERRKHREAKGGARPLGFYNSVYTR